MMNLNIYLRPRVQHTLQLFFGAALLAAAGMWLGWQAYEQHRIVEQAGVRNAKLLAIQSSANAPKIGKGEQESLKQWNQLKIERDFPWALVFSAVEKPANTDIELLEFKPDKLNRVIALGGEAKNRKSLIAYLAALSAQPALKNVYLVHQQSVQRDTLETISFEIRATLQE